MMLPWLKIFWRYQAFAVVCGTLATPLIALPAAAATAKLDKETCQQFKTDQVKFIQSGILADLQRGAEWGKANLSAERLREVELFIQLDEQIKFGCREATLTPNLMKVEEIAKRLEMNPNIDPFAPLPSPNAANKEKAGEAKPAGGAAGTKPKAAAPKPKPQAAKKPPVDDAYTGPPISVFEPPPANAPGAALAP